METQTVAPTLPGFKVIKRCIQYLAIQPKKTYWILQMIMMAQMSSYLHGMKIKLKTTQPIIF